MMAKLAEATNKTEKLYGMDVNVTYRVIKHVLDHEVLQSGLNLTHTQDRNFIQVTNINKTFRINQLLRSVIHRGR